jgi:hypothetical protein
VPGIIVGLYVAAARAAAATDGAARPPLPPRRATHSYRDRDRERPQEMVDQLSPADVRFFTENGFLIKESVLDPGLLRRARAVWWAHARQEGLRLKEHDPLSWVGGLDGDNKRMSWICREVGGCPELLDLLPRAVWGCAEQLCGAGTLIWPEGITTGSSDAPSFAHPGANFLGEGSPGQACRGVYARLPLQLTEAERHARREQEKVKPSFLGHVDGWDGDLWRLSVNTTLDDVGPHGGAFTVWPGSHLRMYRVQKKFEYDWEQAFDSPSMARQMTPEFRAELDSVLADTQPVRCHAPAGSAIFWHHKLVHTASENTGHGIRSGVIYEFYKKAAENWSRESIQAQVEGGNLLPDMWCDWSAEVRECALDGRRRMMAPPKL